MAMYDIPTDGCNIEIMGYPFFAESVSPNESFRRRDYNYNNIVGGTMKVTQGPYVPLDFSITTHVFIDPDRPDEHNTIFQEMMSKPVEVISPELGGSFEANVVIKPEHEKLDALKLTINIKEIPGEESLIPGEEFLVPASRDVEGDKDKDKKDGESTEDKTTTTGKGLADIVRAKINSVDKKNKGETTSSGGLLDIIRNKNNQGE